MFSSTYISTEYGKTCLCYWNMVTTRSLGAMNPRLDLHISTNLAAQVQKKTMRSTMFVGYVWLCIMKKIPLKATLFCCLNSTFLCHKTSEKTSWFCCVFSFSPSQGKEIETYRTFRTGHSQDRKTYRVVLDRQATMAIFFYDSVSIWEYGLI